MGQQLEKLTDMNEKIKKIGSIQKAHIKSIDILEKRKSAAPAGIAMPIPSLEIPKVINKSVHISYSDLYKNHSHCLTLY